MMINPESLYTHGHLLATVPSDLISNLPLSNQSEEWLARAYALVAAAGDKDDTAEMKRITTNFGELAFRQLTAPNRACTRRKHAAEHVRILQPRAAASAALSTQSINVDLRPALPSQSPQPAQPSSAYT